MFYYYNIAFINTFNCIVYLHVVRYSVVSKNGNKSKNGIELTLYRGYERLRLLKYYYICDQ